MYISIYLKYTIECSIDCINKNKKKIQEWCVRVLMEGYAPLNCLKKKRYKGYRINNSIIEVVLLLIP